VQDIVRVFLKGDYTTAIECMTLIEESLRYNTREDKDEAIRTVEKSSEAFRHEKNALSQELISILAR
ncbi:MAG: hypothetical protein GX876_08950, partial [Bacteroidales bacterium]|nr:hypothetical protein [Bacteroidales bacterium]